MLVLNLNICCKACHWQYDGTESCDKSDNTGTRHQSGKLSDMVIFSFALFSTTQTEYMYRYDWLIIIMSLLDMIHGL